MADIQWLKQRLAELLSYHRDSGRVLAELDAVTAERDAAIKRAKDLNAQVDALLRCFSITRQKEE